MKLNGLRIISTSGVVPNCSDIDKTPLIKFKGVTSMKEILYTFWLTILELAEMALHYLKTEIGILRDFLDTIGIIGKAIATIGAVIGLLVALNYKRWYISRKKK